MPRAIDDGLRFLLEVGALIALSYWGWHVSGITMIRSTDAVMAPLIEAVIWGV